MENERKSWYKSWWTITLFIIIGLVIIENLFGGNDTSSSYSNISTNDSINTKSIYLSFYNNEYNCSSNGNIYVDDSFLGKTKNGKYLLTNTEYTEKFKINSTVFIFGKTEDCFGRDSNLPLALEWSIPDLKYYFDTGEEVLFQAVIKPRQPSDYSAMQGFVRPEEVKDELLEMHLNMNNSLSENMEIIFQRFYMPYSDDSSKFGVYEYWQTPMESRINKGGDCEDWAVRFVSLLRAYNSSLNCYAAVWDTHVNVICRIGRKFIIYDQSKITKTTVVDENPLKKEAINQENKIAMRSWLKNYFNDYGLSSDGRRLYTLFNEAELLTFNSTEEFISRVVENYT